MKKNEALRCENTAEYSIDVYLWKHELQRKYYVFHPLQSQAGHITAAMRQTLLLWLAAIVRQFGFSLETTCLAASLLDRFLSSRPLHRNCLQLAGLTAFFVAAKAEEVEPPEISELVALSAGSFSPQQFRWMERHFLEGLEWNIYAPTAAFFLDHLVEMESLDYCWPRRFSRRLIERCIADYDLAQSPASSLAHAIFGVIAERFLCDRRISRFNSKAERDRESASSESSAEEELTQEYMKRVSIALKCPHVSP